MKLHIIISATILFTNSLFAGPITFTGTPYTQNFDSLPSTGTTSSWGNDSTIPGWHLFAGPAPDTAVTSLRVSSGSGTTGGFYSLGNSKDRALGGVGSGTFSGWIAVSFINASGTAFDSFSALWNGEQWRNSGAGAQSMTFQYGFGTSFTTVGTWVTPGAGFDWSSPVTGGSAAAVNGNLAGRVNSVGGTLNVPWLPSQTLWLRWHESDDLGSDHALAIDDFSFSASRITRSVPDTGPGFLGWLVLASLIAGHTRRQISRQT